MKVKKNKVQTGSNAALEENKMNLSDLDSTKNFRSCGGNNIQKARPIE